MITGQLTTKLRNQATIFRHISSRSAKLIIVLRLLRGTYSKVVALSYKALILISINYRIGMALPLISSYVEIIPLAHRMLNMMIMSTTTAIRTDYTSNYPLVIIILIGLMQRRSVDLILISIVILWLLVQL
jgi:hypothetical protein